MTSRPLSSTSTWKRPGAWWPECHGRPPGISPGLRVPARRVVARERLRDLWALACSLNTGWLAAIPGKWYPGRQGALLVFPALVSCCESKGLL